MFIQCFIMREEIQITRHLWYSTVFLTLNLSNTRVRIEKDTFHWFFCFYPMKIQFCHRFNWYSSDSDSVITWYATYIHLLSWMLFSSSWAIDISYVGRKVIHFLIFFSLSPCFAKHMSSVYNGTSNMLSWACRGTGGTSKCINQLC